MLLVLLVRSATSEVAFFYLYLFAELLFESGDDVRAEQLLSSAAKIVFFNHALTCTINKLDT